MLIENLKELAQFIAWVLVSVFLLASLPFVLAAMYEDRKDEYPHSGFRPDCPEWVEPLESPAVDGKEMDAGVD